MKSKYCFLRSRGNLSPGDVIYQVWVGSYLREFTKFRLVQEYCKDCGLYFEKWSPEVDSRLDREKSRFNSDGRLFTSPFLSASITIDKLYAMIIDDSFVAFEKSLNLTPFEKWCRYRQTIEYCQSINKTNVSHHAYPHVRKNLSISNGNEAYKAACGFAGILVLIVLDILMTNLMNW